MTIINNICFFQSVQRPDWTTGRSQFSSQEGQIPCSPQCPDQLQELSSLLSSICQGLFFLVLEQSSYSTDHSPPASAEVKNMDNQTSTFAYVIFSEVTTVLCVINFKCIPTIMCSCNYVIGMFVEDNFLGRFVSV